MSNYEEKIEVQLGQELIVLDPVNMEFNDSTIGQYLCNEYKFYNYFGQKLADAEAIWQMSECAYTVKYAEKFAFYKESEKCSDKLAEAKTDSDPDVVDAQKLVVAAKHKVRQLQQHLRAWDKNHDNAQNFGHTLRKEMDKLGLNNQIKQTDKLSANLDDLINADSWGISRD